MNNRAMRHARRLALLLTLSTATLVVATTRDAHACGETPVPYATIDSVTPADGSTGVSRDGVVWITGKGWDGYTGAAVQTADTFFQTVRVKVTEDATGQEVSGMVLPWDGAVWTPSAPLKSGTRYVAEVRIQNNVSAPAGASGDLERKIIFETGATLLAPVSFTAPPTLSFATEQVEYCTGATNDCALCDKFEKRPGRVLTVEVPPLDGGFLAAGRAVGATITTDDASITRSINAWEKAGASTPLWIPIPDQGQPYGVCVTVLGQDARMGEPATYEQCFTAAEVWGDDSLSAGGSGGSGGSAGSAGSDAGESDFANDVHVDGDSGGACSMSGSPARTGNLAAVLGLAALFALRRRRS